MSKRDVKTAGNAEQEKVIAMTSKTRPKKIPHKLKEHSLCQKM
jgi:hypothetical protein